jgi:FtsH-binding integral membrane protein
MSGYTQHGHFDPGESLPWAGEMGWDVPHARTAFKGHFLEISMSQYPNPMQGGSRTRAMELEYGHADTGVGDVAKFFHIVYLWMSVGLAVTAAVSAGIAFFMPGLMIANPWIAVVGALGAFVVSLATNRVAMNVSAGAGLAMFLLYASLIGLMIAPIWVVYSGPTIGAAFILTGGSFAVMSLIGFVTKVDLTRIGMIAIFCAIGLFLASLVNIFLQNDLLGWIITYAIVIVFTVITIWKTQELKNFALSGAGADLRGRMAVVGALSLYIAFINLFLAILRIIGARR